MKHGLRETTNTPTSGRVATHLLLAGGLVVLCSIASVFACIHTPSLYKGVVTERLKEAFMYHDGKLAHLVLRTSLLASGELPETMAWVIPLPSLPTVMEEADEGIFNELFALTVSPPPPPLPEAPAGAQTVAAIPGSASKPPEIRIHPVTVAGNYRLQPIEILSDTAGDELNEWLKQNGFGFVPPENQRYYLRKGAVFLTVKLGALQGNYAEIKPLHLAYKAEHPSFPLKFSTHSGTFDLTLYTLTPDKQSTDALAAFNLEYVHGAEVPMADLAKRAPHLQKMLGERSGWLTRFHGIDYNVPGNMVADLPSDPAFGVAVPSPRLAMSEGTVQTALILGAVAGVTLFLGFLVYRRARNKTPWRGRATFFVLLVGFEYLWFIGLPAYQDYIARWRVGLEWYGGIESTISEISEKAKKKGSLSGVGSEVAAPRGVYISRDGVISAELDAEAYRIPAKLKFVMTPYMKDGAIEWNCAAYPAKVARRYAPPRCQPST